VWRCSGGRSARLFSRCWWRRRLRNMWACRLQRIVDFAERVAAGDLTARIASSSTDEIGKVASALDKTARRVEESFVRVQTSQRELETLLNSMQTR